MYKCVLKEKTLLNKDTRKVDLDKFSFNWNLKYMKIVKAFIRLMRKNGEINFRDLKIRQLKVVSQRFLLDFRVKRELLLI